MSEISEEFYSRFGTFFIGVFLDGTPVSAVGVTFGVVSSMITVLHSIVIKKALNVVKGSALHLLWYTNLLSTILLAPILVLAGELPGIMCLLFGLNEALLSEMSTLVTFTLSLAITGVFGFLMSIMRLLSIKVTSPITHMVSSMAPVQKQANGHEYEQVSLKDVEAGWDLGKPE
ncbi:hypothetical protein WOLCODRAFT_158006 [Wolfiporia cocos MD-104 SS10]|uniref:Uncharacterized protein n=1 Tax=Wolfiporia cocos (strain MD-104) TaxID=742152 RepID=A0A2H3JMQ3_WOLCO|nr:hypothetical protein WOLCODRAFT_158006 [Wolfiporia cocos MD-104 SS10]